MGWVCGQVFGRTRVRIPAQVQKRSNDETTGTKKVDKKNKEYNQEFVKYTTKQQKARKGVNEINKENKIYEEKWSST